MRRCRCCRQAWPIDCFGRYRYRGAIRHRLRCEACRLNCGAARRRRAVERTNAYRARVRAEVEAVRLARVS